MKYTFLRYVGLLSVVVLLVTAEAQAQSSSFFGSPQQRQEVKYPLTQANASWTYTAPPPKKEIQVNDIITVVANYKSEVISEGETDRKKKSYFKAKISDWVLLKNFSLLPDPQKAGDPAVNATWDNKMRSEGTVETREAMQFKIACRVVEKRDGKLVLEGRNRIKVNDQLWVISYEGIIRPEDVLPNNTVLGENVLNETVVKQEMGEVRDSYRRGFMMKFFDKYQLF
ncbi:MAG: flagellar basal body L-ring protein FlgH [Planctomycetia bacterium]|jgi:flagellar L-ring protein precursor FlgH